MALENRELMEYACERFEEGKYDEALESFALLYMRGYEQEWLIETIYNCYMAENDEKFRKAFHPFAEKSKDIYEECILDFIPYRDGEYYIFDKELEIFRGIFSVPDLEKTDLRPVFQEMEFSGAVLELDWDWNKEKPVLAAARNRKIYAICHDRNRCMSFFKITELADYMNNIRLFSDVLEFQDYFHQNTSVYLPRILLGNKDTIEKLDNIIDQEHQYRLTPEGRNTKNVLLTIGIPTANRGHMVLKRLENLLRMCYDAEIEIAISKNCNDYYQEEYDEVGRITDARIHYFDHGIRLKASDNWIYTVEMAHGKYVLFVSDEDDVVIEAVEHYLALLSKHPEAGLIRARTEFQCADIKENLHKKKGLEAFSAEFLRQNYLSGLIVRREDFILEDLHKLNEFSDNYFFACYPHEWWCAILSRRGDYLEDPVTLISENESLISEEVEMGRKKGLELQAGEEGLVKNSKLPTYATYESRLKQFRGYIDFIHYFMEEDCQGAEAGLALAIGKASFLFELARRYSYKPDDFLNMTDKLLWSFMEAIDEFTLEEEQKIHLLKMAESCGLHLMGLHEQLGGI